MSVGVTITNSGINSDAAVVPAFLARSEGESGGKSRDPPRGKGGDHQPITEDFHHSQLGILREELGITKKQESKELGLGSS